LLSNVTNNFVGNDFQDVEVDSFAERSALTDNDDVSFLDGESWWAVDWDVSVSFFVSVVFWNIVKVVSSDNDGPLHFCWDADTFQNFTSDWDVAGEWTFFINVSRLDGLFRCSESQSDVLEISDAWCCFFSKQFFSVQENILLFLEGSLMLN